MLHNQNKTIIEKQVEGGAIFHSLTPTYDAKGLGLIEAPQFTAVLGSPYNRFHKESARFYTFEAAKYWLWCISSTYDSRYVRTGKFWK